MASTRLESRLTVPKSSLKYMYTVDRLNPPRRPSVDPDLLDSKLNIVGDTGCRRKLKLAAEEDRGLGRSCSYAESFKSQWFVGTVVWMLGAPWSVTVHIQAPITSRVS